MMLCGYLVATSVLPQDSRTDANKTKSPPMSIGGLLVFTSKPKMMAIFKAAIAEDQRI